MANELRRQIIHFVVGLAATVAAAVLPRITFLLLAAAALAAGIAFITLLPKTYKRLFGVVERDHAAFRGKGAVFFGLGIFFAALLFYDQAPVAILLVTIPDALATLFGAAFRSRPLPYNRRKTAMGSAVFFVATSLVLSVRYQRLAIFFVAFLLTALESFDYREIPFLDDNLVIPVVAAYLLTFL